MIAVQDLQSKQRSLNEATNTIQREIGSVSKAHRYTYKEDEMIVEGKAKIAAVFKIPDKVIENDLEEQLNQDNELPMNTNYMELNTTREATR
jgi:hypothetical protein